MASTSTNARSIMFRRQDSVSKLHKCEATPIVSILEDEPEKPNRRAGMKKSLSLFFRKKANRLLPRSRSALTLEDTASVTSDAEEEEIEDGRLIRFSKQPPQIAWIPALSSWSDAQKERVWYPSQYVSSQKAEANQAAHFQGNANPQWTAALDAVYKQTLYWSVTTQTESELDRLLQDARALNRACRSLLHWRKRIAMAVHYEEACSFRGLEDWVNHAYRGERHATARDSVQLVVAAGCNSSKGNHHHQDYLARDYHELTRPSVLWARLFAQADAMEVQQQEAEQVGDTSGEFSSTEFSERESSTEFSSERGNESSGELSTTDMIREETSCQKEAAGASA